MKTILIQIYFRLIYLWYRILPDTWFIRHKYYKKFHKKIDLSNPIGFNEKLNYLKLYDRNDLYTLLADKYEVKKYVAKCIGDEYVVPCYGVWSKYEDIEWDRLPEKFVLKATHDSSGAYVCKDKHAINHIELKKYFNYLMRRNWFYYNREWPYKNIRPRIIADYYLEDTSRNELQDYKFWCFDGEPKVMYCTNKSNDIYENFFDMDFTPIDISHGFRKSQEPITRPDEFELMKTLSRKLSQGIPFVRIDFFDVNHHVYFGEFTFYDWAGFKPIYPESWEQKLGDFININNLNY